MQAPVAIECSPDLSIKFTIHEELLRCHSKLLEECFTKAKILRKQFEQTDHLRDQIAAHVFPEVTAEEFAAGDHEEKVSFLRQLGKNGLYSYHHHYRQSPVDLVSV